MGIWVRALQLDPQEKLVWQVACNWKQGGAARGGHLGLTTQALVFEPNRLDALTGGTSRRVRLVDIESVEVEAGGRPSMSGGLRPRMRLNLRNGTSELLLVNRLEQRLAEVRVAAANAR